MRSITVLLATLALVAVGLMTPASVHAQILSVWQLETLPDGSDDGYSLTPSSRYSIQFFSDGSVEVQADCNRATGSWDDDDGIEISITQVTLVACPSGSKGNEFLDRLEDRDDYVFEESGESLILVLLGPYPYGEMIFEEAPS